MLITIMIIIIIGKEARKIMSRAASMQNTLEQAVNYGWRVRTSIQSLTINWKKMSELVMDHLMKENWELLNKIVKSGIEILEGKPCFIDSHTIKISPKGFKDFEVTANLICAGFIHVKSFPEIKN